MSQPEQNALSFERIVFFSDAVFAIVITLLVLEIKVPHLDAHNDTALRGALLHLLPKFLGFLASFFIIGLMWFEHHRIFRFIAEFDGGLIWRNLFFLLTISFIPFPTALTSEYFWSKTAFVFYALSFSLAGLAKYWVWSYAASKPQLIAEGTDKLFIQKIKRRSLAVPLGSLVAAVLALISVYVAPLGFISIPIFANLLDPTKKEAAVQELDDVID